MYHIINEFYTIQQFTSHPQQTIQRKKHIKPAIQADVNYEYHQLAIKRKISMIKVILSEKKKVQQQKNLLSTKDQQISKLRRNLQTAVSTALNQKLQKSKSKQELIEYHHMKTYLQNKIKAYQKQLTNLRQINEQQRLNISQLTNKINNTQERSTNYQKMLEQKTNQMQQMNVQLQVLEKAKIQIKSIVNLKDRIIVLEQNVREERLSKLNSEGKNKQLNKQIQRLNKAIINFKPKEQELRQRIAYFQRVNLDLQRKMQDYNRRENDYIKQITQFKSNLTKVTAQRNYIKTVLQETSDKLQNKTIIHDQLQNKYNKKLKLIEQLDVNLSKERQNNEALKQQIEGANVFYKKQGEENRILKEKYKLLKDHQEQLQRAIKHHLRIADQINLEIIKKIQELKKIKAVNDTLKQNLAQNQIKFEKFDILLKDGSEKSYNQLRQSYYAIIRSNNEQQVTVKQLKKAIEEQSLLYGQQRDTLQRQLRFNKQQKPQNASQFMLIYNQKTQALLLLEKSNDQLLNLKKDLQNKASQLSNEIERLQKQLMILKIKAAQLFKTKKQLQDARKNAQRYQEMIQEERQLIEDLKSQTAALRQRNTELSDKNFMIDLERKNLQVKLKQTEEIINQLNIETLMAYKVQNEKNSHIITDSLQKLQSAVKSLSFFFNCAFCGELPITPVTLAFCGHTYCTKCKEAYQESCYQCDTGQPIQKAFQNKLLKDASGKYKFLTMVMSQLNTNFVRKK